MSITNLTRLSLAAFCSFALTSGYAAEPEGELLYNGIRLPTIWPPKIAPASVATPAKPPYLDQRPTVIPIDVGRQLFVDDFLIAETTLTRENHHPVKSPLNPILKPETEWEIGKTRQPMSTPFSDGAFFDPKTQEFKMWYMAGWFDGTALATSRDGLHWQRPEFDVIPKTNLVIKSDPLWRRDGVSIWLDQDTDKQEERYKMFLYARTGELGGVLKNGPGGHLFASPDGIHWTLRGQTGQTADNTTFFYNPFRKVWVFSHRTNEKIDGKTPRTRAYVEHKDFYAALGDAWKKQPPTFWMRSDSADHVLPETGDIPQNYKVDAVGYESLMLGLFEVLYGPDNTKCAITGKPKLTEIQVGFSRDGFHWDRTRRDSFIGASRKARDWERAYLTSTGGCCLIVGDQLYFYYGAFQGDESLQRGTQSKDLDVWTGMYAQAATGLATLRRDGFASMNADTKGGTLTTSKVQFSGKHLFVNVDNPQGQLQVEVLDESGQVIPAFSKEACEIISADKTLQAVRWKGSPDLSTLSGKPVHFRFHLTNGKLYAFWVSPDNTGASHGFVAAGGPGFTGPRDTVGNSPQTKEP